MQDHATSATADGRAPPVSAAAVARAAGVSSAAVSYVLNGKGGVSPETRRHIIHAANELGFRPRKPSQSTDPQQTRVIGLILPRIINPMFPRWAQGVITAAAESGYEVFVATTQDDPEVLAQVTSTLAHRNVDGTILAASLRDDATALRILRSARIPYVCLSRRADFLDSDFVGIDDDAAATTLMQHMLGHGFTEIATVISPRFSTASLAREQAFVRTAAAAGITISGDRKISTGSTTRAAGWRRNGCSPPAPRRGVRQRRTCHRRLCAHSWSRRLDMSPSAKPGHGTCPPLTRTDGHTPHMPIPGPEDWTCPPLTRVTTGHVLRSPA
jgi:LacI family transcriptional regulator